MKESKKKRDERLQKILDALDREYGTDLRCALTHEDAWELLVATILSAQCTDARVNMVTPALFRKYPEPADFAQADQTELEQDIRSTGFYHNKAKNIIACARQIVEEHGGSVPSDLESLTKLAGVGRKTANVIRGNIYNEPSIVVDTHVKRISRLLGLTDTDDPTKAEFELMEILPKDHWILWNIDIITLGRTICIANRPKCENCFLREYCPSAGRTRADKKSKSGEGVK
jgi:endonuclease-3